MDCTVLTKQVSNPGFLPTSVTVKLPNAKPVEMETWANQGEPTAEVFCNQWLFVPLRLSLLGFVIALSVLDFVS